MPTDAATPHERLRIDNSGCRKTARPVAAGRDRRWPGPEKSRTVRKPRSPITRYTSDELLLLSDRQLTLNVAEPVRIRRSEVLKQPFALVHLHQQSAPAGVVLLMRL